MSEQTNILLQTGTNEVELIEFTLRVPGHDGNEITQYYGINVAKVREIIKMPEITMVPSLPEVVIGVFELRNKIIPAVDLRLHLYNKKNVEKDNKMIVTQFNNIQTGIVVNEVLRIHRLTWQDIVAPDIIQDYDPEKSSIVGIIQMKGKQMMLLDVEKVIADIDPNSAIDNSGENISFDSKIKIFTCDDSAVIRKMISTRLKKSGIEYEQFNDGMELWERLQIVKDKVINGDSLDSHLNLVVSDIEMPRLDGYTLTNNIKNDPILSSLPVILFSSIINKDLLHKGKAVGADAQLSKPQIGELLDTIRLIANNK